MLANYDNFTIHNLAKSESPNLGTSEIWHKIFMKLEFKVYITCCLHANFHQVLINRTDLKFHFKKIMFIVKFHSANPELGFEIFIEAITSKCFIIEKNLLNQSCRFLKVSFQ